MVGIILVGGRGIGGEFLVKAGIGGIVAEIERGLKDLGAGLIVFYFREFLGFGEDAVGAFLVEYAKIGVVRKNPVIEDIRSWLALLFIFTEEIILDEFGISYFVIFSQPIGIFIHFPFMPPLDTVAFGIIGSFKSHGIFIEMFSSQLPFVHIIGFEIAFTGNLGVIVIINSPGQLLLLPVVKMDSASGICQKIIPPGSQNKKPPIFAFSRSNLNMHPVVF